MASKGESCFMGGLGCIVLFFVGGLLAAMLGGHFHIDFGGLVILAVIGGAIGLFVNSIYEKGRQDGAGEAGGPASGSPSGPPSGSSNAVPGGPAGGRRRAPTFVSPWGSDVPPTVSEALSRLTETYWSRDRPDVKTGEQGVVVRFLSRGVQDERVLELEASDATDTVTIRLRDDLGEVFAPTGPWRSQSDINGDLGAAFQFVESVLNEDAAHALVSVGEHRIVKASDLPALISEDPGLEIRSWNGTLDRSRG